MTHKSAPKVLLTRDGDVIVAKTFSYLGDDVIGVSVRCDDGSNAFFYEKAYPTHREFYGIDVTDAASYAEKKKAILRATGWTEDDEFQWMQTNDKGDAIPATDTDETITRWFNAPVDWTLYDIEDWGGRTASEYAPGFSLLASLTPREIKTLKMREGDLGGPASSVPCVTSSASLADLNAAIEKKGLPFLFVD